MEPGSKSQVQAEDSVCKATQRARRSQEGRTAVASNRRSGLQRRPGSPGGRAGGRGADPGPPNPAGTAAAAPGGRERPSPPAQARPASQTQGRRRAPRGHDPRPRREGAGAARLTGRRRPLARRQRRGVAGGSQARPPGARPLLRAALRPELRYLVAVAPHQLLHPPVRGGEDVHFVGKGRHRHSLRVRLSSRGRRLSIDTLAAGQRRRAPLRMRPPRRRARPGSSAGRDAGARGPPPCGAAAHVIGALGRTAPTFRSARSFHVLSLGRGETAASQLLKTHRLRAGSSGAPPCVLPGQGDWELPRHSAAIAAPGFASQGLLALGLASPACALCLSAGDMATPAWSVV